MMKIGCFFDGYLPLHETKDPGQIVLGFLDLGVQAEMITETKPELEQYNASFSIKFITQEQARDVSYWRSLDYDAIVIYTWLHKHYLPVIAAIKEAGKVVLVKGDTDGRISFPVESRAFYYRSKNKWKTIIKRSPKALQNLILRLVGRQKALWLAKHIELADRVIVESPQAKVNLAYIMLYWGKPELIKKISVIPNPVASDVIESSIPAKQKQIVAVGRWDDVWQKNTVTMTKVLCRFATIRPDYEVAVIGPGKDIIKRFIAKTSFKRQIRLHLLGSLPHNEVVNYLGRSQILFMPSNWESFGIAAAEAVCMGCSVVGTPLESLQFLTQGSFSGTLAPDFSEDALLSALLTDVLKWETGNYVPEDISSFWRSRLHRKVIAEKILSLCFRF